jgi:uncharacterized protein with GYD domain
MEAFYYTFGHRDVIVIYTAPDENTAGALSMAVNQPGNAAAVTPT